MTRARTLLLERFESAPERDPYNAAARIEGLLLVIAACFVFASALALSLAEEQEVVLRHFYAPVIWALLMLGVFLVLRLRVTSHDPFILPAVGLLSGWGLVLIDRLAPNFLARQVTFLVISCVLLTIIAASSSVLNFLKRYRYTWLTLGLVMLAATLLFGVNPSGQGATLWLRAPIARNIYFQPSELLKLLLVAFLASYFADRGRLITFQGDYSARRLIAYLAPMALMWSFCMVLLIWQRDLGAATLFFSAFIVLLYLATGNLRYVLVGMLLLGLAGLIGYRAYDVVDLRVDTWINPWTEAQGRGFQIVQSLYALAAGGVLGQGVGSGFPTYIPVVHSDFVYAAVAEEWGLIGALAVIACFAVLAYRGIKIAGRCDDAFRLYLAAGITVILSVQALLIIAGVTKILPLTGVTLPFISYGGSSLLVSAVMAGLLLNISTAGHDGALRRSLD